MRLVADERLEIIRAYGVEDPSPKPDRPMARAAIFLVGRDGLVKRRWLAHALRDRADPADVVEEAVRGAR